MGLLNNKNQNETSYVGGKKHWVDVIKNSGNGDLLIWRQPEEDFNTNSTLVVMPGEEAIFVKGGIIQQTFTNGTYKLETQNYPFISRLRNAFSGGVSTFNCVVYFVRTAHSQEIDWGTMSPIQYHDDTFGNLNVKSYGAFKVHIHNGAKFLTKLLGDNVDFETQKGLKKYFANEFQMHIVNSLSQTLDRLKDSGKVIFETVRNTVEIAAAIEPHLSEILSNYGLSLDVFSVASCKAVSDDPEIQKMITDRARMNYLGQNWAAQQQVDILKNMSNNSGAGEVVSIGAGIGMGLAASGVFGNMGQQTIQGQTIANPVTSPNPTMEKLKQLKEMLDVGLISQTDYESKKNEILSQM
jgi:membrane protease subunit (stomatin/prohibitin family)